MIQEVKIHTVVCDNCKKVFEGYDGISATYEERDIQEAAMNSEWINMGGTTHFCPECYSINDEDKIIIDGNRTNLTPKH